MQIGIDSQLEYWTEKPEKGMAAVRINPSLINFSYCATQFCSVYYCISKNNCFCFSREGMIHNVSKDMDGRVGAAAQEMNIVLQYYLFGKILLHINKYLIKKLPMECL